MDFPKHSILQAFCVMLLAWMLVRCQNPVKPEEEEEEEAMKEADNATLTTTECPSECSCTADGTVDCAGVDLTEFPEELPDKIRRLSLQNNKIKKITVEHISHLHQLETFNLQNNWLTTEGLEAEGFEMLEQLAYLYLANNKVGVKANKMASAWDAKNKRIELSSAMCSYGVCFNGGQCREGSNQLCDCPVGFNGPSCQYDRHLFGIDGLIFESIIHWNTTLFIVDTIIEHLVLIGFRFIRDRVAGAADSVETPPPAPPMGAQGVPRPAKRHSPSSVSWAVSWWDVPGTPP
ncbi:hypothetical protein ATANTOWER_025167 [Ataeniobius toweri]|uniref:EGF-like domain-containing protein n=1 Tax=Ataeniobius toweri TaxID=208326 RepID=A0ABU7BL57_9TELE|nr:hypothetical protein [Ataeniobius toweri]